MSAFFLKKKSAGLSDELQNWEDLASPFPIQIAYFRSSNPYIMACYYVKWCQHIGYIFPCTELLLQLPYLSYTNRWCVESDILSQVTSARNAKFWNWSKFERSFEIWIGRILPWYWETKKKGRGTSLYVLFWYISTSLRWWAVRWRCKNWFKKAKHL